MDFKEFLDFIEKGKKAQIGEIRVWGDDKYKKVSKDKWVREGSVDRETLTIDPDIDTVQQFYNKKKGWTERRVKEVHEPILKSFIREFTTSKPPVATLFMGAPGSGKGTLRRFLENGSILGKQIVVDPDEIKTNKEMLGQDYEVFSKKNPRLASSRVHEEASYLSKEVIRLASSKKADFVEDKVFANYDKLIEEIKRLGSLGYRVRIIKTLLPIEEGLKRIEERFQRTGRDVNREYAKQAYEEIDKTFEKLKKKVPESVDSIYEYDMNVKSSQKPKLNYEFFQ